MYVLLFRWHNKVEGFDIDNILIDEKSQEHILIYDIPYKTLIGSKPLHVRFDKIDGFIRSYDGSKYLTFFGSEKHDSIYNRIRSYKTKTWHHIYFFSLICKN